MTWSGPAVEAAFAGDLAMNFLFAQQMSESTEQYVMGWVVPLVTVGVAGALVLPPLFFSMCAAQRRRAWEHAKRMKALELGHVLPTDQASWARALVCIAIGAGVPVGAYFFTWLASFRAGIHDDVWVAPMVVSLLSVLCGSLLAAKLFNPKPRTKAGEDDPSANGKPPLDADALDVVSRRG
jgi:hypothetical protein